MYEQLRPTNKLTSQENLLAITKGHDNVTGCDFLIKSFVRKRLGLFLAHMALDSLQNL